MDAMAIRRCDMCRALGLEVQTEVDSVHDLLAKLTQGTGPTSKDVQSFSLFFQLVLKRLENFCRIETPPQVTRGTQLKLNEPRTVTLVGSAVVRDLFDRTKAAFDKDGGAEVSMLMLTLQPLKTYEWLLTSAQVAKVREWVGVIGARLTGGGVALDAIADTDAADGAIVAAGGASAPSAASSASSAPPTRKARAQEARTADSHTNMLRFFDGAKSKR